MTNLIFYNIPEIIPVINGTTFDTLEYFLYMKEINIDVQLKICSKILKKENILKLIHDRYDIDESGFEIIKNPFDILKIKWNNILIPEPQGYPYIKHYTFNSKRRILLLGEPEKQEKNEVIFNEMPYYGKTNYTMKFLLHRYKKINKSKNRILLHGTNKGPISEEDFVKYIIPHIDRPVLLTHSNIKRDFPYITKYCEVECINYHPDNFFEQFNKYIYFKTDTWFDPSPRLFVECEHYNKEIIYINKNEVKDGSWYRWNDLQKNGINHRYFNENDKIVRLFKNG